MLKKAYIYFVFLFATMLIGTNANVYAQRTVYRVSDRQVADLLRQIERDADIWTRDFEVVLDRSSYNGTRTEDEIKDFIRGFEEATDRLKERFESRSSVVGDVEEVLNRAASIDRFLNQYRFNARVMTGWNRVRADLNQLADFYNVTWNWNRTGSSFPSTTTRTNFPYRVSDTQVAGTLQQLERNADYFSRGFSAWLDRSALNDTREEEEVKDYIRQFEEATDQLKERFENRSSVQADVENVLNRGARIDDFLRRNRLPNRVTSDWTRVRADLSTLAGFYNVSWNWNNYTLPTVRNNFPGSTTDAARLTGTYRLDPTRSQNVENEISRAIVGLNVAQQERIRRNALRRLQAPEFIAIERSGNTVAIASTMSPRVNFDATGRQQVETMPNGRSMTVNANLVGDQLVISYTGDRANDFYVAFAPSRNGEELRVTRRIYLEGVTRQITVESVYVRTSEIAQFDTIYRGNQTGGVDTSDNPTTTNDNFVIPNGTRLTARLNTDLDTKTSTVGDRFTMEVTSPSEYNGAIIEGRVASVERSGRVSGRARLGLDFDTIRLRNGSTYRFAGFVDSVRATDNSNVSVTNEGEVREGNNQTTRTVTRTAIGAAVGALIGAIAGGGEGAAIGAAVGAGAGAGSVVLQGRDDLLLKSGTEVSISATAPRGTATNR